jgi:hypothetical protein
MQRPKPATFLGTGVYPTDAPVPTEDAVVRTVLVDAVAKPSWAHREWHQVQTIWMVTLPS